MSASEQQPSNRLRLSSMPLAVVLMAVAVLLMLAGVLPVRGGGQESLFRSPVLFFVLALLGASTVACTFRRKLMLRSMGYHLTHASAVLIMIGAMIGAVAEKKFDIQVELGAPPLHSVRMSDGASVDLGFGIAVESFRVDKYPPNLLVLKDNTIISEQRLVADSDVRVGTGTIQVARVLTHPDTGAAGLHGNPGDLFIAELLSDGTNRTWLIEGGRSLGAPMESDGYRVVLGRAADRRYEAGLVLDVEGESQKRQLVINKPIDVAGWRIYLNSYDSQAMRHVTLTLRRDPGDRLVVAGVLGLMIGTALIFFIRRRSA